MYICKQSPLLQVLTCSTSSKRVVSPVQSGGTGSTGGKDVDFRNPPEIRVGAVNKPKTCAALAFVSRSCFSRVRLDTRSF